MTAQEKRKSYVEKLKNMKSPDDFSAAEAAEIYTNLFLETFRPYVSAEIPFIIYGLTKTLEAVKANSDKEDLFLAEMMVRMFGTETACIQILSKQ